ncbi:MAG TPA: class I SAM-dependent methyltransferase [Candidatus Paceibacterota bacterium]
MMQYAIRKVVSLLGQSESKFPIKVIFANGNTYQNLPGDPEVTIVFKSRTAELRSFIFNYVGFVEAYHDCEIDIEGEDALRKLIRMSYEVSYKYKKKKGFQIPNPLIAVRDIFLEHRYNNKHYLQAKKNLYHHYNMPAEFFHLMNGELYGYTEGYYETGEEKQDEAQYKKYDYMCRKLCLKRGDKVIEVGSAWGSMSMIMAKKYGADVVNYGLVDEQNRIMRERIKDKGLEDKIKIEVRDHRELKYERERYDKYVSLGVFEHAGKDCQEEWIEAIAACLKPGGIGVMTFTGRMGEDKLMDYIIEKYIWFGCYLPSLASVLKLLEKYELNIVDIEESRFQYADTMQVMLDHVLKNWPKINEIDPTLFNEQFKRIWTLYYTGSIESFRTEGNTNHAFQVVFVKGRGDVYPRTRNFLYEKPYELREIADYAVPFTKEGPMSAAVPPSSIEFLTPEERSAAVDV